MIGYAEKNMKLTWTIQSIHSLILCIYLLYLLEKVTILALVRDVNLTNDSVSLPILILIFKDEIFFSLFVKLDFFSLFLVYRW